MAGTLTDADWEPDAWTPCTPPRPTPGSRSSGDLKVAGEPVTPRRQQMGYDDAVDEEGISASPAPLGRLAGDTLAVLHPRGSIDHPAVDIGGEYEQDLPWVAPGMGGRLLLLKLEVERTPSGQARRRWQSYLQGLDSPLHPHEIDLAVHCQLKLQRARGQQRATTHYATYLARRGCKFLGTARRVCDTSVLCFNKCEAR